MPKNVTNAMQNYLEVSLFDSMDKKKSIRI